MFWQALESTGTLLPMRTAKMVELMVVIEVGNDGDHAAVTGTANW